MTDSNPVSQTTDLVPIAESDIQREAAWLRRDGYTFAASLLEALWAQSSDREVELRAALVPFANAARSRTVQDALSFGRHAPHLKLTRGFDHYEIDPWAFARALELT